MADTVKDGLLGYYVNVTMENGSTASAFIPYVSSQVPGTPNTVVSGLYTSGAQPTYTTGTKVTPNTDNRGNLRTFGVLTQTAGADGFSNATLGLNGRDAADASSLMQSIATFAYNGTSWDRTRKANIASRLLSSAATTNATSVKASAGDLHKINGNNTVASKRYLKLYNKATAPTVGTDTPVLTFVLAASAPFDINFAAYYFSTGIAYAITGAAADADTTAIAAGDIECMNITYA